MTYSPTEAELWAGRLVACGLNIVPVPPGTKRAAIAWAHLQDGPRQAEGDWDDIDAYTREWWGGPNPYGIAIVTGKASGVIGADLDNSAAVELLERTCGGWPRTVEVSSAKGRHVYFARPQDGEFPNRTRVEGHALDVRGDGGLIVCPPSFHESGMPYRWVVSPLEMWPPVPLPHALRGLLWAPHVEPPSRGIPSPVVSSAYIRAAFERELEAVLSAPVGSRNDQLQPLGPCGPSVRRASGRRRGRGVRLGRVAGRAR